MKELLLGLATDKYKGILTIFPKTVLFFLSVLYGLAVRTLLLYYNFFSKRLSCKVISVGNITLGGTGKTALVEYIVRFLHSNGHKVAVLTRGYKRNTTDYRLRTTDYTSMGDEAFMLQQKLKEVPVIVDADRARGAKRAKEEFAADTVILDDGFQQWKLEKDLEIVAVDASNPFGNGHLIPRGILREPFSSLKRADIFILTKTNLAQDTQALKQKLNNINPSALVFESTHKPKFFYPLNEPDKTIALEDLKGINAALFSGIGSPDSFEKLAAKLGVNIGLSFRFADHHSYCGPDLNDIFSKCKEKNIETLITTEKDAARLSGSKPQILGSKVFVLRVELSIKDEQGFINRLLKLYAV